MKSHQLLFLLATLFSASVGHAESPPKMSVAVMPLTGASGMSAELVDSLSQLIPDEIAHLGPFSTISKKEINEMLSLEAAKDAAGCNDVVCFAQIGGALGVEYLVSGSVTQVESTYAIQLRLTNVSRAAVENRVSREYRGAADGLFDEVRLAASQLVSVLLEAHSGWLVVHANVESASVIVDGKVVGNTPLADLRLPSGKHRVEATKEGFVSFRRDVTVVPEDRATVEVVLEPSTEFAEQYRSKALVQRGLAWTGIGIGVAGLAASAVLFVRAKSDASDLNERIDAYNAERPRPTETYRQIESDRSSVARLDVASLTVGLLSVVALGAGVALFVLGDDPGRFEPTGRVDAGVSPVTSMTPYLSPAGGGLVLSF